MKNTRSLILVSVLSSFFTVVLYRFFQTPEKIIIREPVAIQRINAPSEYFAPERQRHFLSSSPTDFISASSHATPAVVYIRTLHANKKGYWNYKYTASSGSGVIISPDGFVVTNHHVISDGHEIHLTLDDKREFTAELIGSDPSTDLALLKIEAANLPFVQFGNSDSVQVGEWVLAIGNPFRLESTVTAGIVSAKARNISILENEASIESFIQTDAVVNQGNSGGALVNTNGELIGINTAIITQSGKYEGYSFAIPSNLAAKIISDIKDYGEARRGLLGVSIKNMTDELAKKLGLAEVKGVYVEYVNPASAAREAGLQSGDVILSLDGTATRTFPELQEMIARNHPGATLSIEFLRNGQLHQSFVTLQQKVVRQLDPLIAEIGFELKDLTHSETTKYGKSGAKVNSIYRDSKIEKTNMELDFIITTINGKTVTNVAEAVQSIKEVAGDLIELGGFYPQFEGEYFYSFNKNPQ